MSLDSVKKYITFEEAGTSPTGKTKIWRVLSVSDDEIGYIKWHGAWRKYVYFTSNSFYDWDCLRLIADFCEVATKEHRRK